MEKITMETVAAYFTERSYARAANGLFQIVCHPDHYDMDWKFLQYSKEAPLIDFYQALEQFRAEVHQKLAWDAAKQIVQMHFSEAEQKQWELQKQAVPLIMEQTEVFIDPQALLQESVRVNIGVNTGDIALDYTANTVYPAYDAEYSLKETERCASIVWLTKQQGHKVGELYFALDHIEDEPERIRTELMRSIAGEVLHSISVFTQLFFFVRISQF